MTRVLVVDDERFFREAICDVLAPAGITPLVAESGEEAMEHAADESVGVVILDLQLPDMHGLEVFRQLRECRPDLRVIILSAHTDQDSVLEALRLGAYDYLAKPIHEEELLLAVRRALETFGIADGWTRLRSRIHKLEGVLAELWARVQSPLGPSVDTQVRELAVQAASEVLGAAKTSLMLLDEGGDRLRVAAAHGRDLDPARMDPVQLGEGVAGVSAAEGEPILVTDLSADARFADRAGSDRYRSGSFAVAPLATGARALGVLCATDSRGGRAFDEDDLALLRILAGQVAQMLGPAALPEADPREAALARAICEAVTEEIEPARVLAAVLRPVAEILGAAPVSLYLRDASRGLLVREAECDAGQRTDRPSLALARGLSGGVLESGSLVATDAPEADARFDPEVDTPADARPGPLLCGPLRFRGKILGIFRAFPEAREDASPRLGELLSSALSAAVRNVLLYRSLVETIDEVAEARREGSP